MSRTLNEKHQSNSRLPSSRFDGVSVRRLSLSERSFALSFNNVNNNNNDQQYKNRSINNKSQSLILSAEAWPLSPLKQLNSSLNKRSSTSKLSSKINSDFIQNQVTIESNTNKNEKKPYFSCRTKFLCTAISLLIILIIVLCIVLPLKLANSKTTSPSNQLTSQDSACTSGSLVCSTPLFHWNYYCTPASYSYYSCCYLSPTSTQLTIEFQLQEDISHWTIDDISAIQNNGELITNGDFESNLNGWNLTISPNATSATYVVNRTNSSYTGSAYLYSGSENAPVYLTQTFNVILGQNINISFWWTDQGSSLFIPGKVCEATVILT